MRPGTIAFPFASIIRLFDSVPYSDITSSEFAILIISSPSTIIAIPISFTLSSMVRGIEESIEEK
jgi:hypothetical protein